MFLSLITFFIVLLVLYDIAVTILSHGGAGPITKFWTEKVWQVILYFHYKLNFSIPIKTAGPSFIIGIICVWYTLLYICWCIFLSINYTNI